MEIDHDSKKEIIDGLQLAAKSNSRNNTARLREIFDEVEAAHQSGISWKIIVDILATRGLVFEFDTFVTTRQRIKKERTLNQDSIFNTDEVKAVTPKKTATFKRTGLNSKIEKENIPTEKLEEKKLKRPPGITDARWSQMQAKEFTFNRNNN